jgi:signal transduction histidine kinase
MDKDRLYERYRELQQYVGWSEADTRRLETVRPVLEPHFRAVIDDFYAEIERHPDARRVITGGEEQIERLKGTLRGWLLGLLTGPHDAEFVSRRFQVGRRHVEIGLEQVYTNVALSRIRSGLIRQLVDHWPDGEPTPLWAAIETLNKLLDLDLAVIEDAYQAEYVERQQRGERLAAIGQVAGGIAHELRNPLNAVKTSVYYLRNARNPSAAKTAEHLERIDRQVGLADGVITALTDFSRLPLPSLRPTSLGASLCTVLETTSLPENIEVIVECTEQLPPALADAAQLQIVIGNLVRNARDAMPEGGRLTLTGTENSEWIELSVADTGVGIPPDQVARIMEPLYSTKSRGIGLGLAISRAIIDKHHGGLEVSSHPGHGTTFTLRLHKAAQEST